MPAADQKIIKNLSIWGAVFAIIFGTLLHFVYVWSGKNFIVGLFAPVNESPWEHMKLVFTPILLFGLIDFYWLKIKLARAKATRNYPLCFALWKEIAAGIVFILLLFYSYTGIVGHSILAIDIGSFFVAIILAKWLGYAVLVGKFERFEFKGLNLIAAILLLALTGFFFYTTIDPPRCHPFFDSVTKTYGIYQSAE